VLRLLSLDELPQLVNVLRGDMAVVGPRPVLPAELDRVGERAAELLSVRPGITGLWQVSGRSRLSFEERLEIDLRYVRERTVGGDMRILLQTAWQVLVPRRDRAC
jgi:exopolysaccharide production protein ExoY